MTTSGALAFISLLTVSSAFAQATGSQQPTSQNALDGDKSGGWLFPIENLNDTLPRWLRFGGEFRSRVASEDGIGYTKTNDSYLLSRVRVDVTIQPSKWLSFFGETQDSRVFFNHHVPDAVPFQNTWDIRQAYVQLGSSTEGPANLTVGRQVLAFGNERVIGPSDWTNTSRSFDAVRLDLHQTGYEVSLFASSVVIEVDGAMDHHLQGNNLYGVYGSFKNAIPKATLEPYVLWRLAPANAGLPETANRGHLNETTIGLRLAGALPAAFDYEIEMDKQTGSLGANSIRTWAGYWTLGRTFRGMATAPRIFVESNYASGSKNPSGRTWGTFDELYPSNHDKLDFADQFGRKNIQQARAGVEESIGKKWKLRQTYESLWLATTHDALYASSGAISIPADTNATSRHIGQEVDISAQYQVNKGITAGFGCARLFTGRFLKTVSPGKDYTYPFVYLTYRF
jgi:alginate export protein